MGLGGLGGGGGSGDEKESKFAFYTQSTSTVISGQQEGEEAKIEAWFACIYATDATCLINIKLIY